MACLYPQTIVNPRYRNMSAVELLDYCRRNLREGVTYFMTSDSSHAFPRFDAHLIPASKRAASVALPIDYALQIPCGKCPECRRKIRNGWTGRLAAELQTSIRDGFSPIFITLTFRDEYLPQTTKDCYAYLHHFNDAFRKRYGFRLRYAFATDVSPRGRLHLHGILYNITRSQISYELLRNAWRYGFVWIERATIDNAGYVCKYVMKTPPLPKDEVYSPLKHKTRMFTSNGVGLAFALEHAVTFLPDDYVVKNFITVGVRNYPIHPYLKQRMYTDDVRLQLRVRRLQEPIFPLRYGSREFYSVSEYIDFIKEKRNRVLYRPELPPPSLLHTLERDVCIDEFFTASEYNPDDVDFTCFDLAEELLFTIT